MYAESRLTEVQSACLDVIKSEQRGCTAHEVYCRLGYAYTPDEVNTAMRKLRSMELIRKNRDSAPKSSNGCCWQYWQYCPIKSIRGVSE